jgi:predicted aspartyl protease
MTPPLDKARGLMALSEKATPGTWFHCQPFQRVEKNRTVHGSVAGQWVDFISTEPAPVHRRIVVPMHDAESNNRVTSEDMAFIAAACNFARTDLTALLAEVERVSQDNEILAAERNHYRECFDRAVRKLVSIHAVMNPELVKLEDGRVFKFVNPLASECLDELSNRIRAIPDDVAALTTAPAKEPQS